MLKVKNGSIYIENSNQFIDNMCIVVDKETGSIIKYGDADNSDIKKYYEVSCKKYIDYGFIEMVESLVFIEFDRYDGILSIEEICTVVNYGMNCHSKRFLDMFSIEHDKLHELISDLQKLGY